jgi:glyoxylase-like metal-dependent hydrolase (beta-lactamase superfamily II)
MNEQVQAPPAPLIPEVPPQQLAERVWVFPDQRINLVPNIGVVIGDRTALVVDTGMGRRNGERLLERVRELTDKPLLVTLTHFHPEHGWGVAPFAGEATIVYNRVQRDELNEKSRRSSNSSAASARRSRSSQMSSSCPARRLRRRSELDLGASPVTSYHGPAHTRGDYPAAPGGADRSR